MPGWTFRHADNDASRMNLINLPMADSMCMKKLVDAGKDGKDASGGGSKRTAIPEEVVTALGQLGVQSKKLKTSTTSTSGNVINAESASETSASTKSKLAETMATMRTQAFEDFKASRTTSSLGCCNLSLLRLTGGKKTQQQQTNKQTNKQQQQPQPIFNIYDLCLFGPFDVVSC